MDTLRAKIDDTSVLKGHIKGSCREAKNLKDIERDLVQMSRIPKGHCKSPCPCEKGSKWTRQGLR